MRIKEKSYDPYIFKKKIVQKLANKPVQQLNIGIGVKQLLC